MEEKPPADAQQAVSKIAISAKTACFWGHNRAQKKLPKSSGLYKYKKTAIAIFRIILAADSQKANKNINFSMIFGKKFGGL